MAYNIHDIELKKIEEAHNSHMYELERDRLKSRFFAYASFPIIDYYGLSIQDAESFIYSDFIARYNRQIGKNVLFISGYDNISLNVFNAARKQQKPLYEYVEAGYKPYQRQLKLLDIGYDEKREIFLDCEEYTYFVQKFFFNLLDNGFIFRSTSVIAYDNHHIYHAGQYEEQQNRLISYNGNILNSLKKQTFLLDISSIKTELLGNIRSLKLEPSISERIYQQLGYYHGLEITLNTSNYKEFTFKMANPELFFGISYFIVNPNLMDISPYQDESENINSILEEQELIYSGVDVINFLNGNSIPIFFSTKYDEKIHIGIPSKSDEDEFFASKYDLPFQPIFDYVDDCRVLVNSGFLNGLDEIEARSNIIDYFTSIEIAKEYEDILVDKLIISSPYKLGIPIPLDNDLNKSFIPTTYDLKQEVKMQDGNVCEKNLVNDFFNPDFVKGLIINAIRLKEASVILEPVELEAIDKLRRFNMVSEASFRSTDVEKEIFWQQVINVLWKRLYNEDYTYNYDKIFIANQLNDKENIKISRVNNNLISLDDLLTKYGAATIRMYFAKNGFKSTIFDVSKLDNIYNEIQDIISLFKYLKEDDVSELDEDLNKMIYFCNEAISNSDLKSYSNAIFEFIGSIYEIKKISVNQAKVLLIFLSIIMPSLAEDLKEKYLRIREPLAYCDWPE